MFSKIQEITRAVDIFISCSIQTDFETIRIYSSLRLENKLLIIFRRNGHLRGGFLDNLRRISQSGCEQSRSGQFWMDDHPVEPIGRARRDRDGDQRFRLRVGFDL